MKRKGIDEQELAFLAYARMCTKNYMPKKLTVNEANKLLRIKEKIRIEMATRIEPPPTFFKRFKEALQKSIIESADTIVFFAGMGFFSIVAAIVILILILAYGVGC